ncbi:MAG: DUF4836 family protein [Bacteroidales bacterium]|nr:DUF4836 family protein [Bacteroidales bacterium]MCM1147956.1 DUF4836 family protein [Bacteroidales bacterium]MCM1206880.1 DUF4836 family protein [Bacillota bacterium]MCM1509513.1 DUF4836 family protein [Clostridium sp.]
MACITLLCSCNSGDYRNAIPYGCTAVMRIDATDNAVNEQLSALQTVLHVSDPKESGMDFSEEIYLFESSDGNFGLCAKVSDEDILCDALKKDKAEQGPERQGCRFFVLNGNIIVGCTSSAMLAIGPVMPAARGDMYNRMVGYLKQEEAKSPMIDKLEGMKGGAVFVAQASALPDKLAGIFSIGMPKGSDLSQCIIAAKVDVLENTLTVDAEPMSFNATVDNTLKTSYDIFRPITAQYLSTMDANDAMGLFLNIDGDRFLPLLQDSEALWTVFAGINQAVDFNAVMKSIDGDVILTIPEYAAEKTEFAMAAMLKNSTFLNDVGYWKESVPAGAHITDWKKDAYLYSGNGMTFCFGVTSGKSPHFYSGTSTDIAERSVMKAEHILPEHIRKFVAGKKLAVVVNLQTLLAGQGTGGAINIPGISSVNTIVYTVK